MLYVRVGLLRLPDAEEDANIACVLRIPQAHARNGKVVDWVAGSGVVGLQLQNGRVLILRHLVEFRCQRSRRVGAQIGDCRLDEVVALV